ncbi:MAG: hypothetical protein ACT6R2_12165 [Blastomonas fulva]|uniref:hypothetical protein n=1 Tax=Blastomonas fulva TaxID=1550728 RepID=UPI004033CDEB
MSDPFAEVEGIAYCDAIVTFVDILGFRALVAKKSESEVAAAIKRLQQSLQPEPVSGKRKLLVRPIRPSRVHAFSDCVVRVRPVDDANAFGPTFVRELADLASIQASLARAGVFVRGGVTAEKIHSSDTVVFGPGLIRAYELEAQLAHVPRIIVDPAAIQRFSSRGIPPSRMRIEMAAMRRSIRHADDGLWFVDYLRAGAAALNEEGAIRDLLREHRDRIIDAAYEVDVASSVLPKYLWAAKYHNGACGRILKKTSIPGITISKNELPSFERLRLPILLKR